MPRFRPCPAPRRTGTGRGGRRLPRSARHLSFVETGRAQPSPELLLALAEHLQMPLRERNALLLAAGYAPRYRQTRLDDPAMAAAHDAMDRLITLHDPYPGVVIDQSWNVVLASSAAAGLAAALPPALAGPPLNVFRACLHPWQLARPVLAEAAVIGAAAALAGVLAGARLTGPLASLIGLRLGGHPGITPPAWLSALAVLVLCVAVLTWPALHTFTPDAARHRRGRQARLARIAWAGGDVALAALAAVAVWPRCRPDGMANGGFSQWVPTGPPGPYGENPPSGGEPPSILGWHSTAGGGQRLTFGTGHDPSVPVMTEESLTPSNITGQVTIAAPPPYPVVPAIATSGYLAASRLPGRG